ncbi:MAG: hypothetical protein LC777_13825, partial [Actinobacteria bacterium]|nr:hypothetical protein [Actinomycetota bacterium]
SHAGLLDPLAGLVGATGYELVWAPRLAGGASGLCRQRERRIEVLAALPANGRVAVLIPWRKRRIRTFGVGSTTGGPIGACPVGRTGAMPVGRVRIPPTGREAVLDSPGLAKCRFRFVLALDAPGCEARSR